MLDLCTEIVVYSRMVYELALVPIFKRVSV